MLRGVKMQLFELLFPKSDRFVASVACCLSCGFWSPFLKTIVLVACSSGSTNDSNDDSDHNLWGPTIRLKVKECRDTLNSTEDPSFINDSASSLMILLLLQKKGWKDQEKIFSFKMSKVYIRVVREPPIYHYFQPSTFETLFLKVKLVIEPNELIF